MANTESDQLLEELEITPLRGKLVALKTRGELDAETDFGL